MFDPYDLSETSDESKSIRMSEDSLSIFLISRDDNINETYDHSMSKT